MEKGSRKTVIASSKSIWCFLRFASAFSSSHSKLGPIVVSPGILYDHRPRSDCDLIFSTARKSLLSRSGISSRICSAAKPATNKSRISTTRIRMPRTHGRPPHCSGLIVTLSIKFAIPFSHQAQIVALIVYSNHRNRATPILRKPQRGRDRGVGQSSTTSRTRSLRELPCDN